MPGRWVEQILGEREAVRWLLAVAVAVALTVAPAFGRYGDDYGGPVAVFLGHLLVWLVLFRLARAARVVRHAGWRRLGFALAGVAVLYRCGGLLFTDRSLQDWTIAATALAFRAALGLGVGLAIGWVVQGFRDAKAAPPC